MKITIILLIVRMVRRFVRIGNSEWQFIVAPSHFFHPITDAFHYSGDGSTNF